MADAEQRLVSVARLLASGGWADQDPDVLIDLLRQGRHLANLVLADEGASAEVRGAADLFLASLRDDTWPGHEAAASA